VLSAADIVSLATYSSIYLGSYVLNLPNKNASKKKVSSAVRDYDYDRSAALYDSGGVGTSGLSRSNLE